MLEIKEPHTKIQDGSNLGDSNSNMNSDADRPKELTSRNESSDNETDKRQTQKEFDIDPLRGWICLNIVVEHMFMGPVFDKILKFPYFSFDVDPEIQQVLGSSTSEITITSLFWFIFWHVRLGAESFFVLAGFFLAHNFRKTETNYLSMRGFLVRRYTRLLIPFWIALTIGFVDILVPSLVFNRPSQSLRLWSVVSQYLGVNNLFGIEMVNYTLWSMTLFIQYYFLWSIMFWVIRRNFLRHSTSHERTERVMAVVLLLVGIIASLFQFYQWDDTPRLFSNAGFVALGAFAYWNGRFGRKGFHAGMLLGMLFFAALQQGHMSRIYTGLLTTIILIIIGNGFQFPKGRPFRGLVFLGKRSYSIYLTHAIIGFRFQNLSNHLNNSSNYVTILFFLMSIIVSIIFGCFFYKWIERPILKMISKWEYRR